MWSIKGDKQVEKFDFVDFLFVYFRRYVENNLSPKSEKNI